MTVLLLSIVSALVLSLLALTGRAVLGRDLAERAQLLDGLVSLAVGALLGGALIHLIPRAIAEHGSPSVLVMTLVAVGFVGFFALEKGLHVHAHHPHKGVPGSEGHQHEEGEAAASGRVRVAGREVQPIVPMILIGDGVHNVLDGAVLFAAYSVDLSVGLVATAAIAVHEVAQEVGDLGVLVRGGLGLRRALVLNLGTALASVAGVLLAFALDSAIGNISAVLLPLAAGNFLYIAAADLVPTLHHDRHPGAARRQVLVVTAGVAAMAGLRLLRQTLT